MKKMTALFGILAALGLGSALMSCDQRDVDRTQDKIERGVDKAGDKIERAGDKIEEKTERK